MIIGWSSISVQKAVVGADEDFLRRPNKPMSIVDSTSTPRLFEGSNVCILFHRDLRIVDNTALELACASYGTIIPVFVLEDSQVGKNEFKSQFCINFMVESIVDLDKCTNNRLHVVSNSEFLEFIKRHSIVAVYSAYDYTPFAKKRDEHYKSILADQNVDFIQTHDTLLLDRFVEKPNDPGKYYKKFTPFYNHVIDIPVRNPAISHTIKWSSLRPTVPASHALEKIYILSPFVEKGGRSQALIALSMIPANYSTKAAFHTRTTELSAHLKFGTISPREAYVAFRSQPDLARQLYWRDFYYTLCMFDPNAFLTPYDGIEHKWDNNTLMFEKWCSGTTGVPIIDAAMTQLNTTGRMQGRCRMIVADFLIKVLHINWQQGEKYFAQHLVDYDPAQNNYNWQWVAGTGPFGQPKYRMFNPYIQAAKYDPDAIYIKKWLPAYKDIPAKDIHDWENKHAVWSLPPPIKTIAEAKNTYF